MKILKIVVNGLPHVKDELNIDFVAQQRVDTYDKSICLMYFLIYM